jgi:hypothetical protein
VVVGAEVVGAARVTMLLCGGWVGSGVGGGAGAVVDVGVTVVGVSVVVGAGAVVEGSGRRVVVTPGLMGAKAIARTASVERAGARRAMPISPSSHRTVAPLRHGRAG